MIACRFTGEAVAYRPPPGEKVSKSPLPRVTPPVLRKVRSPEVETELPVMATA